MKCLNQSVKRKLSALFLSTLTCTLLLMLPGEAHALRQKVCAKSSGELVVKRRCRAARGESSLDLAAISTLAEGPQGQKGDKGEPGVVNLAGCVVGGNEIASGTSIDNGDATVQCPDPDSQFMLSYSVDLPIPNTITDIDVIHASGSTIPIGVFVRSVDPRLNGGQGAIPAIELTCCPRS